MREMDFLMSQVLTSTPSPRILNVAANVMEKADGNVT